MARDHIYINVCKGYDVIEGKEIEVRDMFPSETFDDAAIDNVDLETEYPERCKVYKVPAATMRAEQIPIPKIEEALPSIEARLARRG